MPKENPSAKISPKNTQQKKPQVTPAKLDANKTETENKITDVVKKSLLPTKAKKLSFMLRAESGTVFNVFHNKALNKVILHNPAVPVLYNEKGARIGYVGKKGEFVFAKPPNNKWPKGHPNQIKLDEIAQMVLAKKLPKLKPKALGNRTVEPEWGKSKSKQKPKIIGNSVETAWDDKPRKPKTVAKRPKIIGNSVETEW